MAGIKGQSGPAKGNKNAMVHGARVERHRLVIGELPPEMVSVRKGARKYRAWLEALVLDMKGLISPTDEQHLNTAATWEMVSAICRWVLKNKSGEMGYEAIERNAERQGKARERRDAAFDKLGVDVPPEPITLENYVVTQQDGQLVARNGK